MNKAEQMGYGSGRGTNPDGQPLPASNGGSFNQMSEGVAEATTHAGEWQKEADHVEAVGMDRARTQQLIDERIIAPRDPESDQPSVQELNEAAHIAIYGTGGRTAGFTDVNGNPLTQPIPGRLEEIRNNPRYGTKQADREAAADKYKTDVESLVAEGFELSQASLIMDIRENRANQAEIDKRAINKDFSDNMNMLTNQYMNNGKSRAEATKLAKDRLARRNITEYKKPTKTALKKEDDGLKKLIRDEGIFTQDEYAHVSRTGGTLPHYGAQTAPEAAPAVDNTPTAVTAPIPVTNPTRRGLGDRARALMARAHIALQNGLNSAREYFNDDEHGTRRKVTAGVVGAVALAGTTWLAAKGVYSHDHSAQEAQNALPVNGDKTQHAQPLVDHLPSDTADQAGNASPNPNGNGGSAYDPSQIANPGDVAPSDPAPAETVRLKHGDTIWHQAQMDLIHNNHHNPTNAEILARTQHILDLNDLSWDEAHHLADGTEIKLK